MEAWRRGLPSHICIQQQNKSKYKAALQFKDCLRSHEIRHVQCDMGIIFPHSTGPQPYADQPWRIHPSGLHADQTLISHNYINAQTISKSQESPNWNSWVAFSLFAGLVQSANGDSFRISQIEKSRSCCLDPQMTLPYPDTCRIPNKPQECLNWNSQGVPSLRQLGLFNCQWKFLQNFSNWEEPFPLLVPTRDTHLSTRRCQISEAVLPRQSEMWLGLGAVVLNRD